MKQAPPSRVGRLGNRVGNSLLIIVVVTIALGSRAHAAEGPPWGTDAEHLGKVDFPISCNAVQAEFNRGVALLHHMTYPQAREVFEHLSQLEPRCAMAHWGIAMTLFQPLWPTRPRPEDLRRGWDEVQKANELNAPTERERLFIAAAAAFFSAPSSSDYWLRIQHWENAMEKVHAAFPKDREATVFYALAHLAAAPPDEVAHRHADEAARLLAEVLKEEPQHPGAMHYLVHANDVPGREHEQFDVICGYAEVAPRNAHALHMPTHIFTRLGDWQRVIRGNLLAAEAALEVGAGKDRTLVWDEFPHAIEYLVYAYLQQGADDRAAMELKRLRETERLEPTFKTAFHLASTSARYALERRAWAEAASLPPREPAALNWDRFPWAEAVTWFARGSGAAHVGKTEEAQRSAKRLQELEDAAAKAGEELFARNIRVLKLATLAWLAQARQEKDLALTRMREAAELEAATPKHAVTPAPTLPAEEQLGELFLEQQRPGEARAAFERSLKLYPRRFNSLLGAARSARAAGAAAPARSWYGELLSVAGESTRHDVLAEAKAFVDGQR